MTAPQRTRLRGVVANARALTPPRRSASSRAASPSARRAASAHSRGFRPRRKSRAFRRTARRLRRSRCPASAACARARAPNARHSRISAVAAPRPRWTGCVIILAISARCGWLGGKSRIRLTVPISSAPAKAAKDNAFAPRGRIERAHPERRCDCRIERMHEAYGAAVRDCLDQDFAKSRDDFGRAVERPDFDFRHGHGPGRKREN